MASRRLLIATLMLTLAVAITAAVFAIWPVVADAPWEDSVPVADSGDAVRCQGALDYRAAIVANPPTRPFGGRNITDQDAFQRLLDQAQREIIAYC